MVRYDKIKACRVHIVKFLEDRECKEHGYVRGKIKIKKCVLPPFIFDSQNWTVILFKATKSLRKKIF